MSTREKLRRELNVTDVDSPLMQDIILDRRRYFIKKVKQLLMKALVWAFDKRERKSGWFNAVLDKIQLFVAVWNVMQTVNRYPVPTRENCYQALTHASFDIWDEFFLYEDNPAHPDPKKNPTFGREPFYRALQKLSLCSIETDWYQRQRVHWWIKKVHDAYESGVIPELIPVFPDRRFCWKEPVDKKDVLKWLDNLVSKGLKNA